MPVRLRRNACSVSEVVLIPHWRKEHSLEKTRTQERDTSRQGACRSDYFDPKGGVGSVDWGPYKEILRTMKISRLGKS